MDQNKCKVFTMIPGTAVVWKPPTAGRPSYTFATVLNDCVISFDTGGNFSVVTSFSGLQHSRYGQRLISFEFKTVRAGCCMLNQLCKPRIADDRACSLWCLSAVGVIDCSGGDISSTKVFLSIQQE